MMVEKQLTKFVHSASLQTGFTEEEVKCKLRKEFGTFNNENISKYMKFLHEERSKADEESLSEQVEKPGCPYHPEAETWGDLKWYGRYTRTPAWKCAVGGIRCFIRAKMDGFLAVHNIQIDWKAVDEAGASPIGPNNP